MLLRLLVENSCHVIFLSEAESWKVHKQTFKENGLMAIWSHQTKGNYACLVRGSAATGTSLHIMEESPPGATVEYCVVEGYWGNKFEPTAEDVRRRARELMPKGRGNGYRNYTMRFPQIFRGGFTDGTHGYFVPYGSTYAGSGSHVARIAVTPHTPGTGWASSP